MHAQIVANPATDDEFVSTVRKLARRERSHRVFEANLRTRYPHAAVRPSEISGDDGQRWYVYRDGRWGSHPTRPVASVPGEEP